VQVARLAGMPAGLVRQARPGAGVARVQQRAADSAGGPVRRRRRPRPRPSPSPLADALARSTPIALTPREALDALYRLKILHKESPS
jgi:DNA mismatch repair protein MutS